MVFPADNTLDLLTRSLVLGPITVLWVVVLVRLVGLRTFSKMTAFDFVVTVAIGSLLANAAVADSWPKFIQSSLAILAVLAIQALLAKLRQSSDTASDVIANNPQILMREGEFFRDTMAQCRVSEGDIWGKLREANVMSLSEVRAVILETTGDISVLHGEALDEVLLTGVATSKNDQ